MWKSEAVRWVRAAEGGVGGQVAGVGVGEEEKERAKEARN